MPLTPDQIVDRMTLKKHLVNWRFIAIVALLLMVVSLFANKEIQRLSVIDGDYIARIFVEGVIMDDFDRTENLKTLSEDKRVKAVILHINSPGGTTVGGESLYISLKKLATRKPLVVVIGDYAASAAYMGAVASDHLISYQSSITGSIGVIAQTFEYTELAEKIGIKFHNFKSSPLKGGPLPNEKLSPEMKDAIDSTVSDIYEMFVEIVAERRLMPKQRVYELANGKAYTGRQAIKLGLVDAIGDEDTAIEWLKNTKKTAPNLKVHDYTIVKQDSKLDRFLDSVHTFSSIAKSFINSNLTSFF